jgi:hypothetical protein
MPAKGVHSLLARPSRGAGDHAVLLINGAKPPPLDVAARPSAAELGWAALVAFADALGVKRDRGPPKKGPAESQLARFRGTAAPTSAAAQGRLPQRHRDHDSLGNTFSRFFSS